MDTGPLAFLVAMLISFCLLAWMWAANLLTLQRFFRSLATRGAKNKSKDKNHHILLTNKKGFNQLIDGLDHHILELEASEKRTARWVSNVAHDLRAPLSAIQGYAGIMESMPPILSQAENREYASAIVSLGDRLQGMISDLSQISLMKSGEKEMEWEVLSLAELVFDTLPMFSQQIEEKGIRLKRIFPHDLCLTRGNIRLIERAIQNILQNGIQYCDASGEFIVEVGRKANQVELIVSNSARELSIDQMPKLFRRGRQGENGKSSGSGLGLAIVNEIIHFHKGYIQVESNEKGMITFCLSFKVWE